MQARRIPGTIARDIGMQIVSGRFKPGDILKRLAIGRRQ
jgi:DNA-binding FadR family transcriptional regulator